MSTSPIALSTITLLPSELSQKDKYKLLIGCVVPRPIAFVSTVSRAGLPNVAPFSFFNGVSSEPPCLMFSVTYRGSDGQKKDTLRNIEETGEFVVNVVTESIVAQANQASAEYPADVNEFEATGLTMVPSQKIIAPRVAESPINLECELYKLVPVGPGGAGSATIVIGEIVAYHLREDVYHNGRIDLEALQPVSRLAGSFYAPVHDAFEIQRPQL
ncbi:MAG: flavin reductase family protein [Vampirovibrionales bacterium]